MKTNLNGIIIEGKVYEAIIPETDSCKGCAFQEEEFGCIKAHCHSFKPTNFGRAKHIFRFSPELTERLNKERMTPPHPDTRRQPITRRKEGGMTDEQIEKTAQQHADELRVSSSIPGALVPMLHDIAKSSYTCGAQDSLSHQWVSVEERLPGLRERVLICEKIANQYKIFIGKRVPFNDGWEWNQSTKEGVVAWMPLPKYNPEKQSI